MNKAILSLVRISFLVLLGSFGLLAQNFDTSFSEAKYDRKKPPTTWHGGVEVESSTGAVSVNLPIGKGIGARGVRFQPTLSGRWAPQATNSYTTGFDGVNRWNTLGRISFGDPCGMEVTSPGYLKMAIKFAPVTGLEQHFLLPSGQTGAITSLVPSSNVNPAQIIQAFGYSGTPTRARIGTNRELILDLPPDPASSQADPLQIPHYQGGNVPESVKMECESLPARILIVDGSGATATEYQYDGAYYQKPHIGYDYSTGEAVLDSKWLRTFPSGSVTDWHVLVHTLYNVVYRAVATQNRFGDVLKFTYSAKHGPGWTQVSWYPKGTKTASEFTLQSTGATFTYSGGGVQESYTLAGGSAWTPPDVGEGTDYLTNFSDGTSMEAEDGSTCDPYEPSSKGNPTSLTNNGNGEQITWNYTSLPSFSYGNWDSSKGYLVPTRSNLVLLESMTFPGRTVKFKGWTVYPYSKNLVRNFADNPNLAYRPMTQSWFWGVTQVDEVDTATSTTRTTLHNRAIPIPAWVAQSPSRPTTQGADNNWSTTAFRDMVTHPDGSLTVLTFASPNSGNALTGLTGYLQNQAFAKHVEIRRDQYGPGATTPYLTTLKDRFDLHTPGDPAGDITNNATPFPTRTTTWDADTKVLNTVELADWDATNLGWNKTNKFISTSGSLPACSDVLGASMNFPSEPAPPPLTTLPSGGLDRSETRTYGSDAAHWFWGRMLTSKVPGQPLVTRAFNADNTLSSETYNDNDPISLKLSYSNFDGPNPKEVSLIGGSYIGGSAGATYTYDGWGYRNKISRTGADISVNQTNDPFGRPTQQKGPNGETTDISWDQAGRLRTVSPVSEEATVYTPESDHLGVTITRNAEVSYVRYNGFGEVIWEGRKDINGIWSHRSFGYDLMGRRTWETGWRTGRGSDYIWTSPMGPEDQHVEAQTGWTEITDQCLKWGTADDGSRICTVYKTINHPTVPEQWTYNNATHYEYNDPRGRVTRVVNANLEVATTSYSGLMRTVVTGQKYNPSTRGNLSGAATVSTVYVSDLLGRLSQVITTPDSVTFLDTEYSYDDGNRIIGVLQYPSSTFIGGKYVGTGTPQSRTWVYNSLGWLKTLVQPESGTTEYSSFDVNGKPWTTVYGSSSPTPVTLGATFDSLGRMLSRTGTGVSDTFVYDTAPGSGKGKLASATSGGVARTMEYLGRNGRLSKMTRTIDGLPYPFEFSYDTYGKLTSRKYPAGKTQVIHYRDDLGMPDKTGFSAGGADNSNLVSGLNYDPTTWNLVTMAYTNSATATYQYDLDQSRLSVLTHAIPGQISRRWEYKYTDAGRVGTDGEDYYGYDLLGRLTSASVRDVAWEPTATDISKSVRQSFSYDGFGNRIESTVRYFTNWTQGSTPPTTGMALTSTPTTFPALEVAFAAGSAALMKNQLPLTLANGASTGAAYDYQGNLNQVWARPGDSSTQVTLSYDALARVSSCTSKAGTELFTYDDEGLRIKVVNAAQGKTTYNIYNEARQLVAQYIKVGGGAPTWKKDILYIGTKEVAEVSVDGKTYVTLCDHLGTPRYIWSGSGAPLKQKFLPFGEQLTNPTTAANIAKGFTNHEQTDQSGLIYMQARYYLPFYGRFASPDPARDQHFEETQSWNINSYVQNNPVQSIDPTGMVMNPETVASPGTVLEPEISDVHTAVIPTPITTKAELEQGAKKIDPNDCRACHTPSTPESANLERAKKLVAEGKPIGDGECPQFTKAATGHGNDSTGGWYGTKPVLETGAKAGTAVMTRGKDGHYPKGNKTPKHTGVLSENVKPGAKSFKMFDQWAPRSWRSGEPPSEHTYRDKGGKGSPQQDASQYVIIEEFNRCF